MNQLCRVKMEQSFNTLHALVVNNLDFFLKCKQTHAPRFVKVLSVLRDHIEATEKNSDVLHQVAPLYDLDENTVGNGYRSYLSLIDTFLTKTISICRHIGLKRNGIFFRPDKYCRELESATSIFGGFRSGLACLHKMLKANQPGELFSPNGNLSAQELLDEYITLDQTGFYGRHLGFYYCESMRRTLLGVSVIMASFSDLYQKSGGAIAHAAASLINGGKYSFYPEARARQIVHVAQNASVEFIKAFWSLSESHLMKQVPNWLCPQMGIYEELYIPTEPLYLPCIKGGELQIPPATAHLPLAPVRCRLMCHVHRRGQVITEKRTSNRLPLDPSPGLLFHCHGGGFVSQTPESHEIYLRDWARDLDVPILSVDYSLAPQAPFPRALEEVLHTYAWALLNKERLGWTGEKVIVAGDSAGGNLVMGLTLKAIDMGIRIPDAVFCVYTPLILDLVPSPSRILCVLDPLLPLGFMLSCLNSYAGLDHQVEDGPFVEEPTMRRESATQPDGRKSSSKSPRSSVIAALDSGITLIKGLSELDVEDNAVEAEEVFASFHGEEPQRRVSLDNSELMADASQSVISPHPSEASVPPSGAYADAFLTKYVKSSTYPVGDSCMDQDEHLIYEVPTDISFNVHRQCCKTTHKYVNKLTNLVTSNGFYKRHLTMTPIVDGANPSGASPKVPWFQESRLSISEKFRRIKIAAANPFMSPLQASDELLKHMPPVYFVSPTYDPTLDDSVVFSRRLRKLNRTVSLSFVDKLPHGFLNFLPFSKEAHEGAKLCVAKIKEGFGFSHL